MACRIAARSAAVEKFYYLAPKDGGEVRPAALHFPPVQSGRRDLIIYHPPTDAAWRFVSGR